MTKQRAIARGVAVTVMLTWSVAWPSSSLAATSAGLVESQCKLVNSSNLTTSTIAAGLCTFLLRGFVDGMSAGAHRGLRVAFIDDTKNLATSGGIDDLQRRIEMLKPKAECLPPQATIRQLTDVFLTYMENHPERRNELYPVPLTDAIESYFCPR